MKKWREKVDPIRVFVVYSAFASWLFFVSFLSQPLTRTQNIRPLFAFSISLFHPSSDLSQIPSYLNGNLISAKLVTFFFFHFPGKRFTTESASRFFIYLCYFYFLFFLAFARLLFLARGLFVFLLTLLASLHAYFYVKQKTK